jgi:hypothetical protein
VPTVRSISAIGMLFGGLVAAVGLAALLLYWRDSYAKSHGKTIAQVQARFSATLQFRWTLELCIPGVIFMVFGIFWAIDRGRQHESDWWVGLPFIALGWVLVPLLARKSWRRYQELQKLAGETENEFPEAGFPSKRTH